MVFQEALRYYELVFDAVYTPKITRLLREAQEVGTKIVTGLEMFIGQAYEQYERFTGLPGIQNLTKISAAFKMSSSFSLLILLFVILLQLRSNYLRKSWQIIEDPPFQLFMWSFLQWIWIRDAFVDSQNLNFGILENRVLLLYHFLFFHPSWIVIWH